MRFEIKGMVGGEERIVVEHVTRLRDDDAPDWPQGEGYRILVEGEPHVKVEVSVSSDLGDHNHAGCLATAMHVVNAIPARRRRRPRRPHPPRPPRLLRQGSGTAGHPDHPQTVRSGAEGRSVAVEVDDVAHRATGRRPVAAFRPAQRHHAGRRHRQGQPEDATASSTTTAA